LSVRSTRPLSLSIVIGPLPPPSTLFPYTTLFRSQLDEALGRLALARDEAAQRQARLDESDRLLAAVRGHAAARDRQVQEITASTDRKSTRLNSSHEWSSYAVFCLKKKKSSRRRQR